MVSTRGHVTKEDMLGALNNILNNFVFGMVASRIVPQEAWSNVSSQAAIFQGPTGDLLTVRLEPLYKNLASPSDRKILIEEFENGLKRSLMREGHEAILWYTKETGQLDKYRNVAWFQFARIMRNIVSHKQGGILWKWPNAGKGVTQVSWRNRTLDTGMVGKSVYFTHQEALQLFVDQLDFARSLA